MKKETKTAQPRTCSPAADAENNAGEVSKVPAKQIQHTLERGAAEPLSTPQPSHCRAAAEPSRTAAVALAAAAAASMRQASDTNAAR